MLVLTGVFSNIFWTDVIARLKNPFAFVTLVWMSNIHVHTYPLLFRFVLLLKLTLGSLENK